MRIDVALVAKGLCKTRQEAKEAILHGGVLVNNIPVKKVSKDISEDAVIHISWNRKYVSRGGEKIESAFFSFFGNESSVRDYLKNKTALDIGSSTGGFTDFLLKHGAGEVTCVDVGTSQLHSSLRPHSNIHLFENTDIRDYKTDEKFDCVVGDVSFIPLFSLLETIFSFSKAGTFFCLLIKPQFEVGKGNTKKGIVKDISLTSATLDKYEKYVRERGGKNIVTSKSALRGGDGNQEYFILFTA